MIKKTQKKVKNDKFIWEKNENGLQYNKAKKANSSGSSDENTQSRFPLSHINKHQPLKQLSTNFQHTRTTNNTTKHNRPKPNNSTAQQQLRLSSQTSLNDLSPIASVEMSSCSGKMDPLQKLQFMQNFDKLCRQTIIPLSKENQNVTFRKEKEFNKVRQQSQNKNGKKQLARGKGKSTQNQEKVNNYPVIRKELKYDYESINKTTGQQNKVYNKSPPQDFQILDIYSTSLLTVIGASQSSFMQKKRIQIEQKKQQTTLKNKAQILPTQQRNQRKCGGIKKNSLTSTFMNTSTQSYKNNPLNYQTNKTNHQNSTSITHITTSNNNDNLPIPQYINNLITYQINSSFKQLFLSISINKITISQQQMQAFPFTCEMRLILGPILTKFRQKKYTTLDRQQFMKQYMMILNDFSQTEKQQICEKILSRKYYVFDQFQHYYHESQYQHERQLRQYSQYLYSHNQKIEKQLEEKQQTNEFLQEFSCDYYNKVSQQMNRVDGSKVEDRLLLLTSKVDNFLSRISSEQYHTDSNISDNNNINNNTNTNTHNSNNYHSYQPSYKKQKLSTLMSRLSQIQEISHDSEGPISSISNSFADDYNNDGICPHNNVYVDNETLMFDDNDSYDRGYREKIDQGHDEESLMIEKVSKLDDCKRVQEEWTLERRNGKYVERELFESNQRPQPVSLTHSRQKSRTSKVQVSSLSNSRSLMTSQLTKCQPHFNPYIWQVNSDHNCQQTFRQQPLSIRSSINLSFSELQKYLP